jgi:hypothetical protein
MAKMTEQDLIQLIEQQEQQSHGYFGGELGEQRADAIDRYLGNPYGDEEPDRSAVVDTSIRDTVEWVMPQLLRVFMSGDEVVRFEAEGQEDEDAAKLETSYLNYLAMERNEAFQVFSSWFRDALLLKNGYVKVYWDRDESVLTERYVGKTDDELAFLMQDSEVEVIEHSSYPDPMSAIMPPQIDQMTGQPVPMPPQMLHDVKIKRVTVTETARYEAVPPEEMMISKRHRHVSLRDCEFVCHRTPKTMSDLREMGYKVTWDEVNGNDIDGLALEDISRDRFEDRLGLKDDLGDESLREVTYREIYMRCDFNGDGKAELRRVCMAGRKVLHNEDADMVPFAALTPIPFPHRHHGMSYHDLLRELERIKTSIVRQFLDNLYLSNNVRMAADSDNVALDDLLTVKPGGIVRTIGSPGDKLMPLVVPSIGAQALQGIQYVDSWKENSTGINAYYQGLDPNALNKTATGINQLMSASMARTEAIARSFADGVKELFQLLHALTLKHATKAEKVKLDNKWVAIDPREWKHRKNLKVAVGLGTGSKEAQAQQLQGLIAMQIQGLQLGVADPAHVFNSMSRFANLIGYRNAEEFFGDPKQKPPQPQQPPPELQIAQMKMQAEQAKMQGDMQLEQGKAQMQMQLSQAQAQQQAEIERYKAELKAQTDIQVAQIKVQSEVEIAQMKMRLDAAISDRQDQRMAMMPAQGGQQ